MEGSRTRGGDDILAGLTYDSSTVIVVANLVTTTTPGPVVVVTTLLRRLVASCRCQRGLRVDAYDLLINGLRLFQSVLKKWVYAK